MGKDKFNARILQTKSKDSKVPIKTIPTSIKKNGGSKMSATNLMKAIITVPFFFTFFFLLVGSIEVSTKIASQISLNLLDYIILFLTITIGFSISGVAVFKILEYESKTEEVK